MCSTEEEEKEDETDNREESLKLHGGTFFEKPERQSYMEEPFLKFCY